MTEIELERLKMYQDSFKHMTTFCSGAILLASAVTGALFLEPKPDYPQVLAPRLLALSIILLAVGAAAAMLGLVKVPQYMVGAIDDSPGPTFTMNYVFLGISVVAAYLGILFFAIFAVENLTPKMLPI